MTEEEILQKYSDRLTEQIDFASVPERGVFSREYEVFREEAMPTTNSFYENACQRLGNFIELKVKDGQNSKIAQAIDVAHLRITPTQAYGFAVSAGLFIIFLGILALITAFLLSTGSGFERLTSMNTGSMLLGFILILVGGLLIKPLSNMPEFFANRWRLRASNQMVLCVLYVVMYMRHTSNLEHAIRFAAENIENPLSLDFRKVFWDVEIRRYSSIKESLDAYLDKWKDSNPEFVQSFNLIQGSLYEPSDSKRLETLDKALNVMLEGTYNKMMNFAHNLHSPITMLHMLGIILPILGLVIFPLVASFMKGMIKGYHLMVLYNIILPVIVYFFGMNILSKRPTGYSETKILEGKIKEDKNLKFFSFFILLIFLVIGFSPVILHYVNPGIEFDQNFKFMGQPVLDYKGDSGPYGLGSLIISLFVPLGVAFSLGTYYKLRTKNLLDTRKKIKKLEEEFAGSLFQLGHRVGEGVPVEIAFEDVAKNLEGSQTGKFFALVSMNIRKGGMGVDEAIFNKERGALNYFPSGLISSSMRVLVQAAKKSPLVVSKSLISISEYVQRINKVNLRLKDLLAEIISSMKSQISFMAPMIAGIVVGISSMVVSIINKLSGLTTGLETGTSQGVGGFNLGPIAEILNIEDVIPGFTFQIVVGLYVVQVIWVLTILSNSIENGEDKLTEKYSLGKNLIKGTLLYAMVVLIGAFIFNLLVRNLNLGA